MKVDDCFRIRGLTASADRFPVRFRKIQIPVPSVPRRSLVPLVGAWLPVRILGSVWRSCGRFLVLPRLGRFAQGPPTGSPRSWTTGRMRTERNRKDRNGEAEPGAGVGRTPIRRQVPYVGPASDWYGPSRFAAGAVGGNNILIFS